MTRLREPLLPQSPHLWWLQGAGNILLFALFTGWLLLPISNLAYIIFNALAAVALVLAWLVLHAGTFNAVAEREQPWRRGLRHAAAFLVVLLVAWWLWRELDGLSRYAYTLPNYWRSIMPRGLRRHVSFGQLFRGYRNVLGLLHWYLLPALLLPWLRSAAVHGFGGFGRAGWAAWLRSLGRVAYWFWLAVAVVVGVEIPRLLMAWTPNFEYSRLPHELVSLGWRLALAYAAALIAWMATINNSTTSA